MTTILVTGANGQLARCIKNYISQSEDVKFLFYDSTGLDISSKASVNKVFSEHGFNWCINCAAYTAVDKAETNFEEAQNVNVLGAKNLAEVCKEFNTKLVHISTDYVFNGEQNMAYTEEDVTKPLNIYGVTKLQGEKEISSILDHYFILRTSWLYSEFGNNFLNTMLRLSKEKEALQIVGNQIGTPTYAGDLAQFIIQLIATDSSEFGLFNYSNEGVASWYDFAKAIFEISKIDIDIVPIPFSSYPTPAKRPTFSVLDNTKIKMLFRNRPPYWRDSLKHVILDKKD